MPSLNHFQPFQLLLWVFQFWGNNQDCCTLQLLWNEPSGVCCFPRSFHANLAGLWSCFKNLSSAPLRVAWTFVLLTLSKSLTTTDKPKVKSKTCHTPMPSPLIVKKKNEGQKRLHLHFLWLHFGGILKVPVGRPSLAKLPYIFIVAVLLHYDHMLSWRLMSAGSLSCTWGNGWSKRCMFSFILRPGISHHNLHWLHQETICLLPEWPFLSHWSHLHSSSITSGT